MVRTKTQKFGGGERKIDGDVRGGCRRLRQIADSILEFLGG
jgi:hypothetical protein